MMSGKSATNSDDDTQDDREPPEEEEVKPNAEREGAGEKKTECDSVTSEKRETSDDEPLEMNQSEFLQKLFDSMLLENQRRDQLIEKMLNTIIANKSAPTVSANPSRVDESPDGGCTGINAGMIAIMPEIFENLPSFDGDVKNASYFLESMTSAQTLHGLPDNYMLETARTRMTAGARFWYQTYQAQMTTWADFVQQFKTTFLIKQDTTSRWKKMIERVQTKNELVDQYFHEKVKLCSDLGLSLDETKHQILVGLYSRNLSDAMFPKTHFSIDHLFTDIHLYDMVDAQRRERMVPPKVKYRV